MKSHVTDEDCRVWLRKLITSSHVTLILSVPEVLTLLVLSLCCKSTVGPAQLRCDQ